ncbi:MAG: dTDP-4-dehydrorhamnose reductase, partial [Rudaea sp.]
MKILLLGANGQVGFELMRTLAPLGELVCATRAGVDDTSATCLKIDLAKTATLGDALKSVAADVVVNAAAYTAVDRAEDEPELADRINHRALAEIGAWAAPRRALVVHYSTDYVFDGTATRPYREDDATAPLGVYGRSKLAGENALRASGCAHLILRTAWVYAARGHNFLRTMLRLAHERDSVGIVDDQHGAPTTARLIANATAQALGRWQAFRKHDDRQRLSGVYHLCATGECTWYEFARRIFIEALAAGLIERPMQLTPIATADYP